jgi:hypothetical protein
MTLDSWLVMTALAVPAFIVVSFAAAGPSKSKDAAANSPLKHAYRDALIILQSSYPNSPGRRKPGTSNWA